MIVIQSSKTPASMRHAFADIIPEGSDRLLVVSAYVTLSGTRLLVDSIERKIGRDGFEALAKQLVFSFDFGLSEPQALQYWMAAPNAQVFVAGARAVEAGVLIDGVSFHPKAYLIGSATGLGGIVGSANLTGRGFTSNTEVGWAERNLASTVAQDLFEALRDEIEPLTPEMLARYAALRPTHQHKASKPTDAEPVPDPAIPGELPTLWEAISSGAVDPATRDQMWVQVSRAEGGSHNQIELARGAHRFFGATFQTYHAHEVVAIVTPKLVSGSMSWIDRPLRWHGNNGMERFNLPTEAQGGYRYDGSIVLFRKTSDGWEFVVAPWDSDLAKACRTASQSAGLTFRVGQVSDRVTGFI